MERILKQRLTGAVVLVSLAVIFIPIILEGPDNEWTPHRSGIPEQPQLDYRASMELELPDEGPAAGNPAAEPVPGTIAASGKEQAPERPEHPAATPVVLPEAPAPAPAPAPPREPASSPVPPDFKGWYVQVGSFGLEMNASGLQERLQSSGFDAHIKKVDIGKGQAYRVLVGPSESRATAEKLAKKIQSGQQLKGMVIEYPG